MLDLERFQNATTMSGGAGFRVVSAWDRVLGRRVVVVLPTREVGSAAMKRALERLFEAHLEPAHRAIAKSAELSTEGPVPCVVFDTPARFDLETVVRHSVDERSKFSHAELAGFIGTLGDAIVERIAPRGATSADEGSLGTIGCGNVVVGDDGDFFLLGFGHNVLLYDAEGRFAPTGRWFQAPEVAMGMPATRGGDFVALLQLSRGLMPYVEIAEPIVRCMTSGAIAEDHELAERILWVERNVLCSDPKRRPSIRQTTRVVDRAHAIANVVPDPDEFRRHVTRLLGTDVPPARPRALLVAEDGSWFVREGEPVVLLESRRVLMRLVRALADARVLHPGSTVAAEALVEAGWPGDRALPTSALNRLYVSVNMLRRLGLGADLVRGEGGYLFAPKTPFGRRPGPPPERIGPFTKGLVAD